GACRQNGSHRATASRRGQRKRRSSNQEQDAGDAREHQFLRHQFRTWLGLAVVYPSIQPQPLANRHRSLSDHHYRLPSQTPRRPPNHGSGCADDDPVSCLYPVPGLLPSPGPKPCSRKMRDLSRVRQTNRLLVRDPCRQYRLTSCNAGRDVSSKGSRLIGRNAGDTVLPPTDESARCAPAVNLFSPQRPLTTLPVPPKIPKLAANQRAVSQSHPTLTESLESQGEPLCPALCAMYHTTG